MAQLHKFLAIEEDNRPHTERSTIWLYGDDGYRFFVKWVSGPQMNLDQEWEPVMEYKHCNYGERPLINWILKGWHDSEAAAIAAPVKMPAGMTGLEFELLAAQKRTDYPDLGDARKIYAVTLTEPEINALFAATGFMRGACNNLRKPPGFPGLWRHYGATLDEIDRKLGVFEDGNAPFGEIEAAR